MVATNMKQLDDMLKKHVKKALTVASSKIEADMYEETGGFYTKGEPKMYERTGALGDTPRTTAIITNGSVFTFNAYLDQSHQYTTGKSPLMSDVLAVANDHSLSATYGLMPPLGRQHFWDRAEKKIERTLNKTMRSFFRK